MGSNFLENRSTELATFATSLLVHRRNTNSTNFSGRLLSFQNAILFGLEGVWGFNLQSFDRRSGLQ
jgi:hypothetical protein